MPPHVRALAVDVDGTLLDLEHHVTPAAGRAIAHLKDGGVMPVVCTSRPPAAIADIVRRLDLHDQPVVTCQGAVWGAFDRGGLFEPGSVRHADVADAENLTRRAQDLGFFVSWFYAADWIAEKDDPMIEEEERITGASARRVDSLLDGCPPPSKILVMAPPGREPGLRELQAGLPAGLTGATSRPDYLEVVPQGVSKWSALREVYESFGIPLDRTAAIGDGNNDLEMIERSAVGIAMGHSPAALLVAADWVAPDNGHEGFAAAAAWILREHGVRQ